MKISSRSSKEKTKAAVQETLGWLEANTEIVSTCEGTDYSGSYPEHASRALHGLISSPMGLVECLRGVVTIRRHDLVLVGDST